MIIWLILIDVALDNVWILLGENWCWSLLGLNGKEGDFKDFEGSEVDEGDEISGYRYW